MPSLSPGIQLDDAIVLLLGASWKGKRGRLEGITRLEKLVFLLERETPARSWMSEDAEFGANNFGPFSAKVYQAIDLLTSAGIVEDSTSPAVTSEDTWEEENVLGGSFPFDDRYVTRDLSLTDRGWKYFDALTKELPDGALAEISKFKDRFATVPLRQLVRYVYQKPEYETYLDRSIIKSDVLG